MYDCTSYTRFSVTMAGALLVFLGATILANTGDVSVFLVRLVGFAGVIFALVTFVGHAMRASSVDAIPFEELIGAGGLLLAGSVLALFPAQFTKVLFSALGILITVSGLADIARSRKMVADDDQVERMTLRVGIVTVAVGLLVTFIPVVAVHAVPIICGVSLVIDGLSELFLALRMHVS